MTKHCKNGFLILSILAAPALASADALDDAFDLLRLTNISQQFDAAKTRQTRDIIRTYSFIVNDLTGVQLPQSVKTAISDCYENDYDFAKFQRGIADILVNTYSEQELSLLKDFHSDLSLPPSAINQFREIVAKAERIRSVGADYIFDNSEGCVEQGTKLVMDFLNTEAMSSD